MRSVPAIVIAVLGCAFAAVAQAPDASSPAAVPPLSSDGMPPVPSEASPPVPPAPPAVVAAGPPGRFSFNRVDGGFLRLDAQTGQVAFCSARAAGWACETAAEDRVALEMEIGRLQDEVAGLKRQLADLREPPPPRPPADLAPPPPPPPEKRDDAAQLRQDLERARIALENAWRSLVDMLVNFQQDMMRKS